VPDANFVEYSLDSNGDLYLKYYFADTSIAKGSAVGDFNLDKEALAIADREAVGKPFPILPRQDLSLKGDWHAWSPKPNATLEDHIDFARQYSPGHIVAITPHSNLVSAAMADIKAHDGRLAVVKITDKATRDAYIKNPALIPRQVSPGFMNLEVPNQTNIKNVRWAHLAAVPKGAYGDKATLYASCIGGNECINHLVAASVAQIDEQTSKSYCPVGASENLIASDLNRIANEIVINKNLLTSHDILNETNSQMSDIANTVGTVKPTDSIAKPAPSSNPPNTTGAPIATPTKPIVRLTPKTNQQAVTPQGNQAEGSDDVAKLREEVAKMQQVQQQNERREQIKKIIPKELFINKGKFDEKLFEAEVEKKLARGESDEQLNDYYTLWQEKQKLINAGFGIPESNNPVPEMVNQMPAAPTGGSTYQTPTEVPGEPTGGSAGNDYVSKSINNLLRYTIRR
jgi:hypothetical protein